MIAAYAVVFCCVWSVDVIGGLLFENFVDIGGSSLFGISIHNLYGHPCFVSNECL